MGPVIPKTAAHDQDLSHNDTRTAKKDRPNASPTDRRLRYGNEQMIDDEVGMREAVGCLGDTGVSRHNC